MSTGNQTLARLRWAVYTGFSGGAMVFGVKERTTKTRGLVKGLDNSTRIVAYVEDQQTAELLRDSLHDQYYG